MAYNDDRSTGLAIRSGTISRRTEMGRMAGLSLAGDHIGVSGCCSTRPSACKLNGMGLRGRSFKSGAQLIGVRRLR